MRATFMNAGMLTSMAVFFTIVISGLSANLPASLSHGLLAAGVSAPVAQRAASLPPASALFAALLGYNPLGRLLSPSVLAALSPAAIANLQSPVFFAGLMAQPFVSGMRWVFWTAMAMSLVGAVASLLRGRRTVMPAVDAYPAGVASTTGAGG